MSYGSIHSDVAVLKARDLLSQSVQAVLDHFAWTQADLSRRMGKSRTWTSNLLRTGGQRGATLTTIDELCRLLGVSPGDLFDPENIVMKIVTSPVTVASNTPSAGVYGTARLEARLLQLDSTIAQLEAERQDTYTQLADTADRLRQAGRPDRPTKIVKAKRRARH